VIEVLVVDDNPIVRSALRGFLNASSGIRIVAEACHGHEALTIARRLRPTVTLLDHRMPIADGLSVLAALAQNTLVLTITSDDSPALIASMLANGARGFLVHGQFGPNDLVRAVQAVAAGQGWLSPAAASVAASTIREQGERDRQQRRQNEQRRSTQAHYGLTTREREVLDLVCDGLSNGAIGRRLDLTEKTVKNHLNHVFAKLNVASRTEAVILWSGFE
jgi:DNA-binding NarL/FixJ family response regulator